MDLVRLLLITSIATIIPGQIFRISFGSAAITFSDVAVFTTVMFFFIYALIFKKSIILPRKIFFAWVLFLLVALVSTIFAVNNFSIGQILLSSLFLLRFIFYFLIMVVCANTVKKDKIDRWMHAALTVGVLFALVGILQIIFAPDLSFLAIYGWDPHINRLAGSLIDPNFCGGLLTVFLAIALSLYLYKRKNIYIFCAFLFSLSIILTFSRSSYLALIAAVAIIGLIKSPRTIIVGATLFALVFFASPKARDRVGGAFALDETAQARLESWRSAFSIFRQNFVLGVGFNTYRYAQEKYGNFSFDNPLGGHSGAGSDSSFMLVLATTGILGFLAFLLFILSIIGQTKKNIKSDYLQLSSAASFLAILIHSQFVNSLFYPQIMVVVWFIVGLSYAKNN